MTKQPFKILKFLVIILALGLCIPQRGVIPVQNATANDWNKLSYWREPWGQSGVHKGIDIFANKGTPVLASTSGLVIYTGNIKLGGNVVAVLGPKWRIYYYAHLDSINAKNFDWASRGDFIGKVGDSGNAKGKPTHLHYSVMSLIPYPWRISWQKQGYKKVFYMNPSDGFEA
jgi:murein DD-endopeptidase MepM/ murein hydrolase activator NlpD